MGNALQRESIAPAISVIADRWRVAAALVGEALGVMQALGGVLILFGIWVARPRSGAPANGAAGAGAFRPAGFLHGWAGPPPRLRRPPPAFPAPCRLRPGGAASSLCHPARPP